MDCGNDEQESMSPEREKYELADGYEIKVLDPTEDTQNESQLDS